MSQVTNKQEIIDEIYTIQKRRDFLGSSESDQILFDKLSDKIEGLISRLRKCCPPDEFDLLVMSL